MIHTSPTNKENILNDDDFIVSKTDLKGRITYGNEIFIKLSGYTDKEILGKPHNIIRHPDMPKVIFQLLWERIKNNREIFAYVKNLSKDGSFYWVYANVTATLNERGEVVDYYSVRRKPRLEALQVIKALYEELLKREKSGGIEVSKNYLNTLLKEKGMSYDEFINTLQNSKR